MENQHIEQNLEEEKIIFVEDEIIHPQEEEIKNVETENEKQSALDLLSPEQKSKLEKFLEIFSSSNKEKESEILGGKELEQKIGELKGKLTKEYLNLEANLKNSLSKFFVEEFEKFEKVIEKLEDAKMDIDELKITGFKFNIDEKDVKIISSIKNHLNTWKFIFYGMVFISVISVVTIIFSLSFVMKSSATNRDIIRNYQNHLLNEGYGIYKVEEFEKLKLNTESIKFWIENHPDKSKDFLQYDRTFKKARNEK